MTTDFHSIPFDDGTLTKLQIFEGYIKEWLPVFLSKVSPKWLHVNIFDFFAGPGLDKNNQDGSPLLVLKHLNTFREEIISKGLVVKVYFNDASKKKIELLKQNITGLNTDFNFLKIEYDSLDFQEAFNKQHDIISSSKTANLILLDQSGVKHINKDVFLKLVGLGSTDFLFFISSSFFNRFKNDDSFIDYLNVDPADIKKENFYNIHLVIFNYYKSLLPPRSKYYLAPFSIKKRSHVYGLIFGTNHTLGIEKFLKVCWKLDGVGGTANFDIDADNMTSINPLFLRNIINQKKELYLNQMLKKKFYPNNSYMIMMFTNMVY